MRTLISTIAALLVVAETGAGCGGSTEQNQDGSGDGVLTTLEVTPATSSLYTVAPGNTVTLSVVAKDQNGKVMTGGAPTFSSDNTGSAAVASDGKITAGAEGTSMITASLSMGGVTKTGSATITTLLAAESGTVTAPGKVFQPQDLNVRAGARVTWTFASVPHTVTFAGSGAPINISEFREGSDFRVFPNSGTYNYSCDVHPGMIGVVHVH